MLKNKLIAQFLTNAPKIAFPQEKEALNASVLLKTLQSLAPQKMGISDMAKLRHKQNCGDSDPRKTLMDCDSRGAWPFWPQAVKGSHDDRLRNVIQAR